MKQVFHFLSQQHEGNPGCQWMLKEFTTIYCNVITRTGCMQWIFKWGSRPPEIIWGLFAFPPNINCLDMNKWRTHFWVLYSMSNHFLSQIGLCSWKSTDFRKPIKSIHWKKFKYSLSLLFETSTILWNGLNAHQIQYNGLKKWFQYIKQV